MKPQSARQKGSRFEREIAKQIEDVLSKYGIKASRMVLSGAVDRFKGDIFTNLPVHFECKNQEKLNFRKAYRQAISDTTGGKLTVVATSRNRDNEVLCLLNLDDLLFLMELAIQGGWCGEYNETPTKKG